MASRFPTFRSARRAIALIVPVALSILAATAHADSAVTCTRVAGPGGSDAAAGTESQPFRTAQRLSDSLSAGDTGCLRAGTYSENLKVSRGGSASAQVVIRSYPGETATIVGRLWVARTADWVTLSNLRVNGMNALNLPSPTINAAHVTFQDDDVTNNHTTICFLLGNPWGHASWTVLLRNRIHDCGHLPAGNRHHGIYIEDASDTQILDNYIYDNADRGIQLYPSAQRTVIRGNVINGNGEGIIFSGADGVASNGNIVEGNVISNASQRYNVEYYYPPGNPIGRGNIVRANCIGGTRDHGAVGISPQVGFTATGNTIARPQFVDAGAKDFRLAATSPCRDILGSVAGLGQVASQSLVAPKISSVACAPWAHDGCRRGAHTVVPGGRLEISGRHLRPGMVVHLWGTPGVASDNRVSRAVFISPGVIGVRVPRGARSGPVAASLRGAVRLSNVAGPIRIAR